MITEFTRDEVLKVLELLEHDYQVNKQALDENLDEVNRKSVINEHNLCIGILRKINSAYDLNYKFK